MSLYFCVSEDGLECWCGKFKVIDFGKVFLNEYIEKEFLVKNREKFGVIIKVENDTTNHEIIYLEKGEETRFHVRMQPVRLGKQEFMIKIQVQNTEKSEYIIDCVGESIEKSNHERKVTFSSEVPALFINFLYHPTSRHVEFLRKYLEQINKKQLKKEIDVAQKEKLLKQTSYHRLDKQNHQVKQEKSVSDYIYELCFRRLTQRIASFFR